MKTIPRALRVAPRLPDVAPRAIRRRLALLVNPFYAKDPHASFGKHVLTPSLALTSIAGATPPGWEVRYWDENLLQGPPPTDPFPEVVGITVHLMYKKSNRFWHLLIRHRLTATVWRPLVEWTCRRHVRFRKRLEEREPMGELSGSLVSAGV